MFDAHDSFSFFLAFHVKNEDDVKCSVCSIERIRAHSPYKDKAKEMADVYYQVLPQKWKRTEEWKQAKIHTKSISERMNKLYV